MKNTGKNTKPLFIDNNKIDMAIERLRAFEPPDGYYLAFSGGKDSIVIKQLAIEAGVKFTAHYAVTTIDPPELIYYMREHHPDVIWDRPKKPFLKLLTTKGFPLRQVRWCCDVYKENNGLGTIITGIRWAESPRRAKRVMFEPCMKNHKRRFLHPIIDWTDSDVWDFIRNRGMPYCRLYDEGSTRIGCLFCPMAKPRERANHLARYPGYKKQFIKAFERLYANRKKSGAQSVNKWESGEAMFYWWVNETPKKGEKEDECQGRFF